MQILWQTCKMKTETWNLALLLYRPYGIILDQSVFSNSPSITHLIMRLLCTINLRIGHFPTLMLYSDLSVDIMESSFVNMLRGTRGKRMQSKTGIFLFAFIFIMWNYISFVSMCAYIDFTWIDFFKYVTILMPLHSIGA